MWAVRMSPLFALAFLNVSRAPAHQPCTPGKAGQAGCPVYTAPAATAVPGPSWDGSTQVIGNTPTTLFNGAVPPNGFMLQATNAICLSACTFTDNLQATPFSLQLGQIFVTPPGYKPIGPVSIFCPSDSIGNAGGACAGKPGSVNVMARGW